MFNCNIQLTKERPDSAVTKTLLGKGGAVQMSTRPAAASVAVLRPPMNIGFVGLWQKFWNFDAVFYL